MEDFIEAQARAPRPLNRLQKRVGGVDHLPRALGRTVFTDLRKDRDTAAITMELAHRGLSTEGPWKKGLLERLKTHEGDNVSFKPRCPDVLFDFLLEL